MLARRLVEVAAEEDAWAKTKARGDVAPISRAPRPASEGTSAVPFTPTQGKYLAFIHRYITKYDVGPAEADIQRHMLVSAPAVHTMMLTVERKGFIVRTPGQARSIRPLVSPEMLPAL